MIYFGPDKNIVIKSSGQYNHVGNSLNKLERQVLRENCKRRAEESLSSINSIFKIDQKRVLNNLNYI